MIATGPRQLTLTSADAAGLSERLDAFTAGGEARGALLLDRAGRILAQSGAVPESDAVTLATLVAADFNANEQLARLLGDARFHTLLHRGDNICLDLEDVAGRAILVTIFETATPAGLVRRSAEGVAGQLGAILQGMLESESEDDGARLAPLAGAEEEIDQMFDL